MARIYKAHKTKRGVQQWGIDYVDPSGERVRRVVGSELKAKLALARVTTELEDGEYRTTGRTTMTFADLFLMWKEHRGTKRSMKADEQRQVWIAKHFGEKRRIDRVTSTDVVRFRDWLHTQTTYRKTPFKAGGVNRVIQHLRALYNFAINLPSSERPVRDNPCKGVRLRREDGRRDRICSDEEYATLREAASPRMCLAMMIAYETGQREGEIAKLTWDRVDLKRRSIKLIDTKNDKDRYVPISKDLAQVLGDWPRRIDGRVVGMRADSISTAFCRLTDRLKIHDLHFHDFRHTCGTNLRRAGVDLVTIKAILGHSSWKAMEVYQTVTIEDMHTAIEKTQKNSKGEA